MLTRDVDTQIKDLKPASNKVVSYLYKEPRLLTAYSVKDLSRRLLGKLVLELTRGATR